MDKIGEEAIKDLTIHELELLRLKYQGYPRLVEAIDKALEERAKELTS